ncbi:ABC transporter permease [Desulfoscipio gibsoniae]|uniref:ABC-type transport system, involved in lipoprotein release, permease component n=1 Tax=Desulfoscipio gibsoniae DSM 7213 TaxID=767817 RepID=R4KG16_9FIRM|nr:FtsX-like permease family protein [Desulfoscipio gibsoniae]AGL01519.1 ABC-type transport system, involved in lipoprotein release, permease component [Desulfoscipio gibsoniae DSM 7213]
MKNYLALAPQYLSAHKKKTRLAMISVALSVALITGIFSMLDVFLQFEKLQVIHDYGNYHLAIIDASEEEMSVIRNRIDVRNSGRWKDLGDGNINEIPCKLGALDEAFAENMNVKVIQGKYPIANNEIMLEQWATEKLYLNVNIGDRVKISFADNNQGEFIVSGIYNDLGNMKAAGVPGVFLSMSGASEITSGKMNLYLVEFKEKVNINQVVSDIKRVLNIADDRVELNNHLLAVIGQSTHKAAVGLYTIGAILFCIVLVAGVVMIYNTFNISVMDRVRQFGLLRCVGASQSQIKKLVKREGLIITLRAIPLGILAGMLMTFICSAILKYYNNTLFGEIPLFSISITGISSGIVIAFLTVFMASLLPAQKAARVSPVNAVMGSNHIKISKRKKKGFLTKILHAEIAMGINNAIMKKKTLFLMSSSIALSIIMFLGFNVLIDFMYASLKTTKPYTPDISMTSEQGLNDELYQKLSEIDGVEIIYGRMLGYVDATFNASRLTDTYKDIVKGITLKDNGLFMPPEKSWLISYDKNQLNWAKEDLMAGELSEDKMNEQNGVIAVARNLRGSVSTETANLQLGDKVYVKTPGGTKELTVMGILRSLPFSSAEPTLTAFITTEALFTDIAGESKYKAIDIQLKNKKDERAVEAIKSSVDDTVTFLDQRQKNAEMNQIFLTMAVFVYGFVAVITLISFLNIINTMNTSIASKTRYLGVMRAVGMSGAQLNKMVLVEAATYSLTGCLVGCTLGVILQGVLIANYLSNFHVPWEFPLVQIILILILTVLVIMFSVISPLKRIKSKGISEVVNSL